jgi:hypothetical protein
MDDPSAYSDPTVETRISSTGVFEILARGSFLPELSQIIFRRIKDHVGKHGAPAGILLDIRYSADLSVVRLSHLIDLLTEFKRPVAVLFGSEGQQQLAVLLHNTLSRREQVAYFIQEDEARAFFEANNAAPPSATGR